MKKHFFTYLIGSLMLLWAIPQGCTPKGQQAHRPLSLTESLSMEMEEDDLLRSLSQVFAYLQAVPEFRSFFEKQVKKQPGGELSLLFMASKDKKIKGEQRLSDLLQEEALKLGYEVEEDFWEELSQEMPLLTLSLYLPEPLSAERWTFAYPLSVVAVSSAFQGKDRHTETAFNLDGITLEVDNMKEPEVEMLLVENNPSFLHISRGYKRVDLQKLFLGRWGMEPCQEMRGALSAEIDRSGPSQVVVHKDPQNLVFSTLLLQDYFNRCGSHTQLKGRFGDSPVDRDMREKREEIVKIQVESSALNKFCKWWKSSCSIEVKTDFANKTTDANGNPVGKPVSEPSKFIIGKRKDMKKDRIFYCYLQTFNWRYLPGIHGDPYAYNFVGKHHNPGASTKFSFNFKPEAEFNVLGLNVNLSVLSTKIDHSYTSSDTHLGGDWVYYEDNANGDGTAYATGAITFWVKEHQ